MNDELEGYEIGRILADAVSDIPENDRVPFQKFIEATLDAFVRWQFCFCASRLVDDISQWRAYSKLGSGVSIEFDDQLIEHPKVQKFDCLYTDNEKSQVIAKSENLRHRGQELLEQFKIGGKIRMGDYVWEVVSLIARFKNPSFEPEQETRWVRAFSGLSDAGDDIKFRPHRLGLCAFLEVPVNLMGVKSITLGPRVAPQNILAVEDFLIMNDCLAPVLNSQVTLR